MRVERCKGSRDLSPDEMGRFRLIEEVFRDCCLKSGYEEVRTPTLEYLHLFTTTGTLTPGMLGKVYTFLDWDGWSGERVVLRPDGTIPVARFYIERFLEKGLAKLFYVTNVFIFEETGKETRERWQCGVELIGAASAIADVELITLALEVLKRLGLGNVELKLSHVGLIRALLGSLGLSTAEQTRVFDRILDGNGEAMAKIRMSRPELGQALSSLLDFKGKSLGFLQNFKALFRQELPELVPRIDDFLSVVSVLEVLGQDYQIDIASARGFEYYTGVTFQFFVGKEKIGGGGRYDALIPLMSDRNVPASGFALYVDCLMDRLATEVIAKPQPRRILLRTEISEPQAVAEGLKAASYLRNEGYAAELDLGGQRPANFRWTLEVRSKAPRFVLSDLMKLQEFEAQSITEVLTLLGKKDADKASTA